MTPQELKNSILQRAIEGRLVEQRAEEGTGAELYKLINKNEIDLIKRGIIKKEKELLPIKEEEYLFEIPKSWAWVRFGKLGRFKKGPFGSALTKDKFVPKGANTVKVYEQKNAIRKDATIGDYYITKEYFDEKLSGFLVSSGDILVSCAGTIGETFVMPQNIEKGIINQALMRMTLFEHINIDFFLIYFNYVLKNSAKESSKGSAIKNIPPFSILKNYLVALPPLAEQKRIVEKIEELMPLVDEYEENWQKLEEFNQRFPEDMKKSLLQEAIKGKLVEQRKEEGTGTELFGKIQKEKKELIKEGKIKNQKPLPEITEDEIPFDIPETWKWVRLGEIIDFKMGKTPPRAELQWWKPQVPWVSIADMQEDGIITRTKEGISNEALEEKFSNSISQKGTLLMSFKLTVGRVSILGIDAVHNEAIISIYPIVDSEDIFKSFLFKILPFITKFGETKNAIKGKTLNSTSINNLILPLPPLAEQKRIVDRLEELLPLCDKLIKNKEK